MFSLNSTKLPALKIKTTKIFGNPVQYILKVLCLQGVAAYSFLSHGSAGFWCCRLYLLIHHKAKLELVSQAKHSFGH